jgi:predicted CoA-substrate-specific enzyme activase
MENDFYCGVDIGSVAVKVVTLSSSRRIARAYERRSHGQSVPTLKRILAELQNDLPAPARLFVAVTGSGGKHVAALLECEFLNEIVALIKANGEQLPQVRTVIEMGGEDSKLLLIRRENGSSVIEDFAMNTLCAAGTGSFLDQQARRLGLNVEGEFGELALKSRRPPRIAGRCSVFAKSDMIHLQQVAAPDYDIVAGLCYAVARNFKSTIARGKAFAPPIAFEGGVAANQGMVRAFRDILELRDGELFVPAYHQYMSALGAAYGLLDRAVARVPLEPRRLRLNGRKPPAAAGRLCFAFPDSKHYDATAAAGGAAAATATAVGYLGVDVGSLSTNVVVIDAAGRVLARRYLMTAGRPLEAVRRGLKEVGEELDGRVAIAGCGTTGSGRYLVGDFIGADIIRNEITAQATAAVAIDPGVDTIFEIGGQDSKYISLDDGVVIDFEMNKACAAGTGSFLQEQAEKLGIKIEEEFGARALAAACPVGCGERCTVFMESDLVSHQHAGADKNDLIAGLAYSIVRNYLMRVVGQRRIGRRIFFQGGVAWNKGVVAAFETILGQTVTVPPHHDVTGAIGVGMLACQARPRRSLFKGFAACDRPYQVETRVCEDCPNMCEIREVKIEGEEPLAYGSRCEKHDTQRRRGRSGQPDLFRRREKLWAGAVGPRRKHRRNPIRIGLPRTTLMFELLPFWGTFFNDLGFHTVLSRASNAEIVAKGLEIAGAESCFPIKISYGHVADLIRRGVDYIFLPSVITIKKKGAPDFGDFVCPYVQALPYTVRAGLDLERGGPEFLTVPVHLQDDQRTVERELGPLRKTLKLSAWEFRRAVGRALDAQRAFERTLRAEGRRVLAELPRDRPTLVIVGRPYNSADRKLSLDVPKLVNQLGALAIPMDFLPIGKEAEAVRDGLAGASGYETGGLAPGDPNGNPNGDVGADALSDAVKTNMYWRYGKRILAAADVIRRTPRLYALYLSNFGCGPDSFITHFFKERLQGKPSLLIEIDEHSADAGVITRIEAFLDSLQGHRFAPAAPVSRPVGRRSPGKERLIYVPAMCDHAQAFAAAFRGCGVPAEALPETTNATADLGRRLTVGKECYPCLLTSGDIMSRIRSPDFDRERAAFFMPSASGPCRFGQYHRFQRLVLDRQGYADVPIFSPDARNSYADFGFLDDGRQFRKLGWQGLVATDVLFRLRCRLKPYERRPGQTETIYRESLRILADAIERRADVLQAVSRCAEMFGRIEADRSVPKPRIGVVGEIYLRHNRYANKDLIALLEDLGAEVELAPMTEWILYTNHTYKLRLRRQRRWRELIRAIATDLYQRRIEDRFLTAASVHVELEPPWPAAKLVAAASPYLHVSFVGEAILSLGKAIEFSRCGAQGIVNAMPLSCMPGTIVTAISRRVRRDCGGIPWLNVAYEGLEGTNDRTRLEAFLYQAERFRFGAPAAAETHRECERPRSAREAAG